MSLAAKGHRDLEPAPGAQQSDLGQRALQTLPTSGGCDLASLAIVRAFLTPLSGR
jgi:hypothetical protein